MGFEFFDRNIFILLYLGEFMARRVDPLKEPDEYAKREADVAVALYEFFGFDRTGPDLYDWPDEIIKK